MRKTILLLLLLLPVICFADTYQGIGYRATLGEVKALFPKATLLRESSEGFEEWESLYSVTGNGVNGFIMIKFIDSRWLNKRVLAKNPDDKIAQSLAAVTEGDALHTMGVTWTPPSPIPVSRFIAKYGEPSKDKIIDKDMMPVLSWQSKGMFAKLTNDEKYVSIVQFNFGKDDCIAYHRDQGISLSQSEPICSLMSLPHK
jgi:hypothetical protein